MSLAPKLPARLTVAEYLELCADGTGRIAELVDGVVRLQDAPSDTHGTITSNLNIHIGAHLRAAMPGCRVVASPGIEPRINADWNHRVPELGVTCGPNRPDRHMMPEPLLLIEVLSPSNAKDTWSNVPLYATVPSVVEILMVDSTKVEAHLLRRESEGSWPLSPQLFGRGQTFHLSSIVLDVPMAEVYRGTYLA